MKSVSILSPTQTKRCNNLPYVWDCILNQTYKNIIEWVIVDGTKMEFVSRVKDTIESLNIPKNCKTKIVLVQREEIHNFWLDKEQDTEVPISMQHYKGVGTVKGAMARHAEEAYADLDTEESFQFYDYPLHTLTLLSLS